MNLSAVEDDEGKKYAYLLQPLKDLQKYWDFDLSSILDGFLAELEQLAAEVAANPDGRSATRVNFSDAAILVQATSHIYNKKVDAIDGDAKAALRAIEVVGKKNKGKKGAEDDGEDVPDLEEEPADPYQMKDYSKIRRADFHSVGLRGRCLKLPTISVMPMSLMPLADFEKCNVPMYSRKKSKEIIGKKDDFKMNTAYMCQEGAMLLDLLNHRLINQFASQAFLNAGRTKMQNDPPLLPRPFSQSAPGSQADQMRDSYEPELADYGRQRFSSIGPTEDVRDGMFDVRRTTLGITHLNTLAEEDVQEMGGNDCSMDGGMDFDPPPTPPPRSVAAADGVFKIPQLPPKKEMPWMIDGAEDEDKKWVIEQKDIKWKRIPMELGTCYVNINTLLRKHKKEEDEADARTKAVSTLTYLNHFIYRNQASKPITAFKDDDWTKEAVSKFVALTQKKRAKDAEKAKKLQGKRPNKITLMEEEAERMDVEEEGGMDFGMGGEDDFDFDPPPTNTEARFADVDNDDINMGVDLGAMYYGEPDFDHQAGRASQEDIETDEQGRDLPPLTAGYQDACLFFSHRYWSAVEATNAEIHKKVAEWEAYVTPLLEEEEADKEFDIHQYGGMFLDSLSDKKEKRTFPELMSGRPTRHISRYMLSMLLMANTYNVEIDYDDGPEVKGVGVTLLTKQRHHEVLQKQGVL